MVTLLILLAVWASLCFAVAVTFCFILFLIKIFGKP